MTKSNVRLSPCYSVITTRLHFHFSPNFYFNTCTGLKTISPGLRPTCSCYIIITPCCIEPSAFDHSFDSVLTSASSDLLRCGAINFDILNSDWCSHLLNRIRSTLLWTQQFKLLNRPTSTIGSESKTFLNNFLGNHNTPCHVLHENVKTDEEFGVLFDSDKSISDSTSGNLTICLN